MHDPHAPSGVATTPPPNTPERPFRLVVLPGDGIGPEVVGEACRLLADLSAIGRIDLEVTELDWGAERFLRSGVSVPADGFELLRRSDAIFAGAFGDPRVPGNEHARDILLGMRTGLDLFVNFRPVRCLAASLNPLARVTWSDIDFVIVRENTEGLYGDLGGVMHRHTRSAVALQEMVATWAGCERVLREAFTLASQRRLRRVTLVDKANALRWAGELWREALAEVAAEFPQVGVEHLHADAAMLQMVTDPGRFSVIVTDNLFGDLLSELGAGLQGGLGLAASANWGHGHARLFEPVHGSAPALAGHGQANPIAAFNCLVLLFQHLGEPELAEILEAAVVETIGAGRVTPDLGGGCSTAEVGATVRRAVKERLRA